MADGSREDRTDPKQMNDLTYSAPDPKRGQLKKCSDETSKGDRVKLSFYTQLDSSELCEKSDSRSGVVADRATASDSAISQSSTEVKQDAVGDDRKKRCFDRYDSSESSDSGVAVLSPTESGGCSSSDITEPGSPRSPGSSCGAAEDSAGARMPPWAYDSVPAGQRRPATTRRPPAPLHRRITEYFSHKMKAHNGLKREALTAGNEYSKKKCLPKNGVAHDLEKYISYLSQTLSPRVLMNIGKEHEVVPQKTASNITNQSLEPVLSKGLHSITNELVDQSRSRDNKPGLQTVVNGFVQNTRQRTESTKEKLPKLLNGSINCKKQKLNANKSSNPSANNCTVNSSKQTKSMKRKNNSTDDNAKFKTTNRRTDYNKSNDVVSSTTKLDLKVNSAMCGSNNISLSPITPKLATPRSETQKKNTSPTKRTNRKSSACIANSKNLTWSKANNLKQIQLQKQNCVNAAQGSPVKTNHSDLNPSPKMNMSNIANGVRQVPMTMNGNFSSLNVPVPNLQSCQPIHIQQPCNGTVTSNNLASFVAVPQNVMLTTLRIPQNGLPAQAVNQHSNLSAFTRQNGSPTKLNSILFPVVSNLNGTVVQIPNIMSKVGTNFVLPQTQQLTTQRQDHLQNHSQILINGTILKLGNAMPTPYTNVNKTVSSTSQPMPVVNKNLPGLPTVGMTVQPKQNYTVNLSHSMLVSQPGFIVTSVPNLNVKETWSNTHTFTTSSIHNGTCSNPIVHHPSPIITNFTNTPLHTSSIPIAPVKPPDNPIQGTDPPSSTVKEPEIAIESATTKCDIPWLTKTVNNNNVLDSKLKRPFAQLCNLTEKLPKLSPLDIEEEKLESIQDETRRSEKTSEEIRRVEEVARREETIFTQITMLKDVSSTVQSSVIESNYCSATTESSESGIGTDKSIDSPSDSQASKECDDDSTLFLSVSVSSVEGPTCQKSPILKQPKTIRFPPKNLSCVKSGTHRRISSTSPPSIVTVCLWENCTKEFESDTDLLEHLQVEHVESQAGQVNYMCQWIKCKVKGKPSCSRTWLERHAMSHGGNKPFKCIVDGCGRRFSTQILLERHVNNHFNDQSSNTSSGKKTTDSTPKLIRRNGKKLRYRRQPWSARMFDFFDSSTMEGLAYRLARCTRWRLGGTCPLREPAGRHTITVFSKVTATRYNAAKSIKEALVTYYPPDVLEDEWLPEKEVKRTRRVEIADLPTPEKVALFDQFSSSYRGAAPPAPAAPPAAPPPSGAAKRKLGRRYGGSDAFWPCGR